jgi:Terminase large subunit, T4likevirus-type, N-terminal
MGTTTAADLAMALDPAAFSVAAGIVPHPWQADVLRSCAPRLLLNCSRQSGKSSTCATLACHTALYRPGSLTLIVSPAERQSKELFRKALAVYRALGRPVPADAETALTLELASGSRIIALPGKEGTIRGYSDAGLILIDEAARLPEETYQAVKPMLAVSGGRLIALSTPYGTRGWWYEEWRGEEQDWRRWKVEATECPHIPSEFLAQEKRKIGSWWWDQEYRCIFRDAQDAVFRQEDIDRMFSEDYETWDLGGNNA